MESKVVLTLMLLAAFVPALALISFPIILKKSAPIFVYLMCLIWLGIYFLGLKLLRYALILGIGFGSLVSILSAVALIKGLNPFAKRGLPVCPFCILGLIVNLTVVFFCIKALLR